MVTLHIDKAPRIKIKALNLTRPIEKERLIAL